MISLAYGIQNMTQVNISSRQKQTHQPKEEPRGKEVGKGKTGSLGLADTTIICRMDKQQGPTV